MSGGSSMAPEKAGPPANFEPETITMKPAARSARRTSAAQRNWQASTTTQMFSGNSFSSFLAISREKPDRPVFEQSSTCSSTRAPWAM